MKKFSVIIFVGLLLLLPGCSSTTITEREGNYVYSQNEEISIVNIDTRETVGTLKMTGVEVLINEPFTADRKDGVDDNGDDIIITETYEQLIQVFYSYNNEGNIKWLSSLNFTVTDSSGRFIEKDPVIPADIQYNKVNRNGEGSFLIAMKHRSDYINISFRYRPLQTRATAKIRLDVIESNIENENSDASTLPDSSDEVENIENAVTDTDAAPKAQQSQFNVYIIIYILLSIIIALCIYICFSHKKQKS